jgi:uncharacterized OB-fold protein
VIAVGATETLPRADPRPAVEGDVLVGARCVACGHAHAVRLRRCSRCGDELEEARFGPDGTVWATTTLHVASGPRAAPYTLAYIDLDDGPRVLAHVKDGPELKLQVAERARLAGRTAHGDPQVEVLR